MLHREVYAKPAKPTQKYLPRLESTQKINTTTEKKVSIKEVGKPLGQKLNLATAMIALAAQNDP